jgi:putative two-component system response regulator
VLHRHQLAVDNSGSGVELARNLAVAIALRDRPTALHVERMSQCCGLVARRLGLSRERSELVRLASRLHDVGKLAIPSTILSKPDKLDPGEWALMKTHTTLGHRLLSRSGSEVMELAATIALTHHERVDGAGYPNGLGGESIPVEGRIAAVCDVFDALTDSRSYRTRAFSVQEAVSIMRAQRGRAFDREILDVFLGALDDVKRIRARYAGSRVLVTAA